MKNAILVIKNVSHEGPGILGDVMDAAGVQMDMRDLNAGHEFPSPEGYRALIVMGGPDSANDLTGKMELELARVLEALSDTIPYLGVCLGLQVGVKAGGGHVRGNEVKEIGTNDHEGKPFEVTLTPEGRSDPFLEGVDDLLPMFHLHGETVDITPSMTLLGTSKWCRNQIVKIADRAYGIQGHLEVTREMLLEWSKRDDDLKKVDPERLLREWEANAVRYRQNCETMMRNFLKIAGL